MIYGANSIMTIAQTTTQNTDDLYYYHTDHLGSSTFLTDINGNPYQFLLYLPYGETMVEQKAASGSYSTVYRYTGQELDQETGLYYYGARYYDPRVSVFLGVDPLAEKYPGWSPYSYTFDNPVRFVDPDGREPDDWYEDKDGNIVYDESITSQKDLIDAGISGTYLGEQGTGIDPLSGDMVSYNCDGTTSCSPVELPEVTVTASATNGKAIASSVTDGVGGLGTGLQYQGGSFRITNGSYNGNAFSPRYYGSGWKGGSVARIKTYQLGTAGRTIGKLGAAGTLVIGAVDIVMSAYQEGGFGTYTQRATGRTVGSLLGGSGGAYVGAGIGAWFGGLGAIPGGVIGGLIGGYGGSKAGEEVVKEIQK